MRKNKGLITALIIIGAVVLILTLGLVGKNLFGDPHAGHNHATADPHAGHNHATTNSHTTVGKNLPIKECFNITKAENGTYSYRITGRNGGSLLEKTQLKEKPVIEVVNDNLLVVINTSHPDSTKHTAVFCDVQRCIVSLPQTGYLCTRDDKMIYWTPATGAYHVFAVDPFDQSGYGEHLQTLEGLYVLEGETIDVTCTQTENGDLKITYPIKDGVKTVIIKQK